MRELRLETIARALAVLIVLVACACVVQQALALKLDSRPSVWVVDAIPVALSELLFEHRARYTSLDVVRQTYRVRMPDQDATDEHINPAIERVRALPPDGVGASYAVLGPDDKGIVDLVELGFSLFGFRVQSVLAAYFLLLFLSCAAYVAAFWRSPSQLLLLAAFLILLYLVMPMVAYNPQLRSVLALRALPVLSMVACLHLILFMAAGLTNRPHSWQIVLAGLQMLLLVFTVHLRMTTLWQLATVSIVGGILMLHVWRRRSSSPGPPTIGRASALLVLGVLGFLAVCYGGLRTYQTTALPEEYRRGDQIATRVFWHNIFSGLAFHPAFAARYRLRIDDVSIMAATRDYLAETGQSDRWSDMGGDVPNFAGLKFSTYDPAVKEMLAARCRAYLRECVEAVVFYKPRSLAGDLAWLYGLKALPSGLDIVVSEDFGDAVRVQYLEMARQLDVHNQRAVLWAPLALLLLAPFVLLVQTEPQAQRRIALLAAVALALGSLLTMIVGYPVPHTIIEPAIALGMLVQITVVLLAASAMTVWRQRRTSQVA